MKLSVVVPAFNEERLLAATLAGIREAAKEFDDGGWELIVCDNNSTDRTADMARAAGARVVFEPHNQISRARNRGAAAATGDWLLFVDADSFPSRELFRDLKSAIDGGDCIAGGSSIAADGDSLTFRLSIHAWNALSRVMRWAAGSFIFCERSAFADLRGFSEELYASEEIELFGRLKDLARRRRKKIEILHRHPLRTSERKLLLYRRGELVGFLVKLLLRPGRTVRSPADCKPWYDGRR